MINLDLNHDGTSIKAWGKLLIEVKTKEAVKCEVEELHKKSTCIDQATFNRDNVSESVM